MTRHLQLVLATAVAFAASRSAFAVAWNATNPSYSATSTSGLADMPTLFIDENVVNNGANSTRGTGTYLGNGWVLTAQHVVQGSGGYGTLAPASSITMSVNIGGVSQTYTADTISIDGSSDIALFHLANANTGTLAELPGVLKSAIYTGSSEPNSLLQLGGFGYWGSLGTAQANLNTAATFHRAFNIGGSIAGDKLNVTANANSRLVNNGYLLGIGESGDSGSGLWMSMNGDGETSLWNYALVGALATSTGPNFGDNNQYSRVSSHSSWLLSTAYTSHATVYWDTSGSSGIQEGSGTWDLSTLNFSNGVDNVPWDNSTTLNADFGAYKGAGGTVTLGASISVANLMFNPVTSGAYTIAGGGSNKLTLISSSLITTYADATISAPIASTGSGVLTKLGPNVLTLSGSNLYLGTLTLGNGATSGGNLNGALRITSAAALGGISLVNITDNNSAYSTFQLDGSAGNISITPNTPFHINANFAGPNGAAADVIENIAGNNTILGVITYFVGGVGYGFRSDAGLLTFAGSLNASGTSGKTFYLRGNGNGAFTNAVNGTGGNIVMAGNGTWTLSGNNTFTGTTSIQSGVLVIAGGTTGTTSSSIEVAPNASSSASLQVSGGTLNAQRLVIAGNTANNATGALSGTLLQTGGIINASQSVTFGATTATSAIGSYSLTGGTLRATSITSVGGTTTSSFLFNGGTLQPTASTTTLMQNLTSVLIQTGGARIDTQSFSDTIAQPLAHDPSLASIPDGGLTKLGTGTLMLSGSASYTGPTIVIAGQLLFAGSTSHSIAAVSGSGTLHVAAGSTLTSDAVTSSAWLIDGTHIIRTNSASTNKVSTLILAGSTGAWTGLLDLTNNALVIQSPDSATKAAALPILADQVAQGAAIAPVGGISSSTTAADPTHKTTVVVDNAFLGLTLFNGAAVDANSLLIETTWLGDSNLDRKVDVTDLGVLATNYGQPTPNGPVSGDFNNDGKVDVTDLGLLATDYGAGTNGVPFSLDVVPNYQFLSLASVPEPATFLSLIPAALLFRNHRRRFFHFARVP
jgi:autotransporter-associated beta strand protein